MITFILMPYTSRRLHVSRSFIEQEQATVRYEACFLAENFASLFFGRSMNNQSVIARL